MAGSSLLLLLDDIAAVLDDVSLMTKVAAKKTAGVLGDDLAVNAEKVTGVRAERELPVVWAVAKGSLRNKLLLVPAALAVSFVAPWLITPVLMLGGLFLCYEGFEKLAHSMSHAGQADAAQRRDLLQHVADPAVVGGAILLVGLSLFGYEFDAPGPARVSKSRPTRPAGPMSSAPPNR